MKKIFLALSLSVLSAPAGAGEVPGPKNQVTTAAGFPHFFTAQYSRRIAARLSLGIAVGASVIPEMRKACGAEVSMSGSNIEAVSRYHFKEKSFFGGLNAGYQDFSIDSAQNTAPGADYRITDGVKVFYVTPHIGWFKVYASGFILGAELGVRVPVSSKRYTERSGPGNYEAEVRKAVDDGLDLLAAKPLPFITLFRFGYAF